MFHLAHQQLYFPMILLQKGSRKGGGEGRAHGLPLEHFLVVLDAVGMCILEGVGGVKASPLFQRAENKCSTNTYE